ncbi:MAG: DUF2752 domain-containing protein [Clostridiales bacterium]|jgi:hypothetical protein|nr:DUF2752 domain-containing protein [Clostridiales bacterium]
METKTQAFFRELPSKIWFRIAFGILAPASVIGGLIYLYFYGNPFVCAFNYLTGLYTPGCGSGRAMSALLRFDIGAAVSYNVLFVVSLPFLAYYFLSWYLRIVAGRVVLPMVRLSFGGYFAIFGAFILFGILRNIPVQPFVWLAP